MKQVLAAGAEPSGKGSHVPGEAADPALMQRVSAGDARAFRMIVERHSPMVHGLAWRMLGDATEAEDVVQESFSRLWVNAKGWTSVGGGLGGWLRRVATNACLDRLRRRRRIAPVPVPERADQAPLADVAIDAERRRAAVAGAIRALPDRQRAAIVLTYYEQVPNAEAAAILGVGVKALESLLVRARQALARALAKSAVMSEGAGG